MTPTLAQSPDQSHLSTSEPAHGGRPRLTTLALASLGVVFGDIGTSPLYAVRECLNRAHGVATSAENVLGIVGIITPAISVLSAVEGLGVAAHAFEPVILPVATAITLPLLCLELTWRRGRQLLFQKIKERSVPLEDFLEPMNVERPARVPGTAVYLTGNDSGTPPALLQGLLHMRAVHERVMLLTIITEKVARVPLADRVRIEGYESGFARAVARYGFMETPDVPDLFQRPEFENHSLEYVTFFLGRETVLADKRAGMALWRERLFAFLTRNAQPATAFFGIPPSQVIEIGTQIEI